MSHPPLPDRDLLARQLQQLSQRDGLGDESRYARFAPALLTVAESVLTLEEEGVKGLVPRARELLADALASMSGASQRRLRAGLNWEGREQSSHGARMRQLAVDEHISDAPALAEQERSLYVPLADFILEQLAVARARAAWRKVLEAGPGAQETARFVTEQFTYYYRIFTPLAATGADIEAFLIRQARDRSDQPRDLLLAALWHFAWWLAELEDFVRVRGGNWVASTPDAEAELVAHESQSRLLLPVSEIETSLLRLSLARAERGEEVPFLAELRRTRRLQPLVNGLAKWTALCTCNPRRPRLRTCEPHQFVHATEAFAVAVEREWYRMAKWYHLPPSIVSAEHNIIGDYYLNADRNAYDLSRLRADDHDG